MAIIRWQHTDMDAMRHQMDRLFNEITTMQRQPQTIWQPAIEIQTTQENVILRAEIPGVAAKDLDIRVGKQAVAIAGEHRREERTERGYFRSEFRYGKFQRVVPLPVAIQNDKIQAEFKDGILTLTLPKVAEARNRVVKVNLTAANTAATTEILTETATTA